MRRTVMRVAAFMVVAVLLYGLLPLDAVLANVQMPVTTLQISDLTDANASAYNFNLSWKRPSRNPLETGGDNDKNYPQYYEIYFRNATQNSPYPTSPNGNDGDTVTGDETGAEGPTDFNVALSPVLEQGSLYVFKVEAVHTHRVANPDPPPEYNYVKAPSDSSSLASQVIYMTDLEVSGKGSGNNMTVTWSNPLFDGRDLFTGYRIYYSPGGELIQSGTGFPANPHVDVDVNDENLSRISGNKLEYTFTDIQNLRPGVKYAVKVEPLYNGREIRTYQTTDKITFNGVTYGISFTDMTKREYRTNDASINLSLQALSESSTDIRLVWDSASTIQKPNRIEIYSSTTPDFSSGSVTLIGTLLNANAQLTNYHLTEMPAFLTYYKILMYVEGSSIPIESEIASYDPKISDFSPYVPTITKVTSGAGIEPLSIEFSWEAFVRKPYNEDEESAVNPDYDNLYLDRDMYYDIWVTDDANNFDRLSVDNVIASIDASMLEALLPSGKTPPVPEFTTSVGEYYSAVIDSNSGTVTGYERKAIEENKNYYIKIVARRKTDKGEISRPAYGSIFIPPITDLPTNPIMISTPPLRIKKNAETGAEEITQSSITIQWDIKWVEIYDEKRQRWHARVGVDSSGKLVFETDIAAEMKRLDLTDASFIKGDATTGYTYDAERVTAALQAIGADTAGVLMRMMDLRNANYEIHVAEYDLMAQAPYAGYGDYLAELNLSASLDRWTKITPEGNDPEHPEYTVTESNNPAGALENNTAYIIFFRPYVGEDRRSFYPAFVVGTTRDERGPVDIKPTVPILEPVAESDMSLTVRWEYTPELIYELVYSENLADYSGGGTVIPWEELYEYGEYITDGNKKYWQYTITGLFPETVHHIWIRSAALNSTGLEYSEWSNPISMTTTEIRPPRPPGGLGPASKEHVDLYNKTNGTTYKPIDYNALIIEWMRDMGDANTGEDIEAGDSEGTELLLHPDMTNTYMVKFNELIANKPYYIRAKTVLTVTRTDDGIQRLYNYVIQLSPDPYFTDMIEVTVPALDGLDSLDPVYTLQKESEWGSAIILYTGYSDDEYDGDKNPEQYPLPAQDFEVIYDAATDTVTFRLRSDGTDASGARDNGVDQRFISKLVADRVFVYEVDLSKYNNQNVANRVVEMPYSIFTAFEERLISLELVADSLTVTLPPGALKTADVNSLADFGVGAGVRLVLNEYPAGIAALNYNESYAAKPQKFSVQVFTPTRTVNMTNLAKAMRVDMKLDSRYSMMDENVGAYLSDKNSAGWQRERAEYNNVEGALSLETPRLANYSAIAVMAPAMVNGSDTVDAMYTITSKLNVKDMLAYVPEADVTGAQFNNLIAAVAKGELSVDLGASLPSADRQSLTRANMLMSGETVSREAGINALVRLYEVKTGQAVYCPAPEETSYADIAEASPQYRNGLLKAGELGFLRDGAVNPQAELTLGDVFYMLDIVMQDAGM